MRPPPQPGTDVEQLRPREADDQQRALAHPLRQVVDQLEQRLLGPVDVLEDEHERLHVGELVDELACGPGDLRLAALALDRLHHARGEPEQLGDRLVAAALDQLLARGLHRVVVRDAGGGLDHLGERPVGDALAVRQRAAGEDRDALGAGEELAQQPALPDAGLAVDGEDVRTAVADRPRKRVLEQLELRLAPDERCRDGDALRLPVDGRERRDSAPIGSPEAAQLERADVLGLDAAVGEPVRALADQDLAGPGGLLRAAPRR